MNMNANTKIILRYAQIIALGDKATEEEQDELVLIEDQLHLTKESILRKATQLGLAGIK